MCALSQTRNNHTRAQEWLAGRWRELPTAEARHRDSNNLRWRLRQLVERGVVDGDAAAARWQAVLTLKSRWLQYTEMGWSLEQVLKVGRRWGGGGAAVGSAHCGRVACRSGWQWGGARSSR